MTIKRRPSGSLSVELSPFFDDAVDHDSLGRLFAGCVVFLDSRDDVGNGGSLLDDLDRFANPSTDLRL